MAELEPSILGTSTARQASLTQAMADGAEEVLAQLEALVMVDALERVLSSGTANAGEPSLATICDDLLPTRQLERL
jgi:hypothetical protein